MGHSKQTQIRKNEIINAFVAAIDPCESAEQAQKLFAQALLETRHCKMVSQGDVLELKELFERIAKAIIKSPKNEKRDKYCGVFMGEYIRLIQMEFVSEAQYEYLIGVAKEEAKKFDIDQGEDEGD